MDLNAEKATLTDISKVSFPQKTTTTQTRLRSECVEFHIEARLGLRSLGFQ